MIDEKTGHPHFKTWLFASVLLLVGAIAAPVERVSSGEVESRVASPADELAR